MKQELTQMAFNFPAEAELQASPQNAISPGETAAREEARRAGLGLRIKSFKNGTPAAPPKPDPPSAREDPMPARPDPAPAAFQKSSWPNGTPKPLPQAGESFLPASPQTAVSERALRAETIILPQPELFPDFAPELLCPTVGRVSPPSSEPLPSQPETQFSPARPEPRPASKDIHPRPTPMPEPPPLPESDPEPEPGPRPEPEPGPLPKPEPLPTAEGEAAPTLSPDPVAEPTDRPAIEPELTRKYKKAPAVRPAPASADKPKGKRGRKSLKQIAAEADLIEIPNDEVLFSKQYYTMGEVAEMFRVNQSLLRFWETEFNILQPRKNKKGDRHFRPVDIKNLHLIYHLLRQRKYTIEGAKEFLKSNKKADQRFETIQRLQQIKAFLLELKAQL